MKKRLFEVVCNACWKIQNWRHQTHCSSCGKQLTNLTHQLAPYNRSLDTGGCNSLEGNP